MNSIKDDYENMDSEIFAQYTYDLIKDESPELKQAICWYADNIEPIARIFENENPLRKEEAKEMVLEAANRKEYILALLICYRMGLDEKEYQ